MKATSWSHHCQGQLSCDLGLPGQEQKDRDLETRVNRAGAFSDVCHVQGWSGGGTGALELDSYTAP